MSGRIARSQRLLDKISARLGITEAGKQWLVAAIDPFHDEPYDCTGYPDGQTAPCVTRLFKETVTLTAPSTAGGGAWDVMLLDTPHPSPAILLSTYGQGFSSLGTNPPLNVYGYPSGASPKPVYSGGLAVYSGPAGQSYDPNNLVNVVNVRTNSLYVPGAGTTGNFRVIAKGFEVHNVTSELHKGGTVTVFSSPVLTFDDAQTCQIVEYNVGASIAYAWADALINPMWPITASNAYALVDSKQWEAKDGCYVPGRMNTMKSPIQNGNGYIQPIYYTDFGNAGTPLQNNFGPALATLNNFGQGAGVQQVDWEPFDFTGAIFTGLDNASALTVDYITVVESFPSSQDANLYPLAKPPPCNDQAALELYSYIIDKMPVGVPVRENGFGDWFADAIGSVADHVAPVLSAIPTPMTQALGAGLGLAGALSGRSQVYKNQNSGQMNTRQISQEIAASIRNQNAGSGALARSRGNMMIGAQQQIKKMVKKDVKKIQAARAA